MAEFEKKDVDSGKGMAVLSYIGILALIPYFAEKKNGYVRYHAVQGINLLIIYAGVIILGAIINAIVQAIFCSTPYGSWYSSCWLTFGVDDVVSIIVNLAYLAVGILAIIGIVYAATGKAKALPIIGKIKFIKK